MKAECTFNHGGCDRWIDFNFDLVHDHALFAAIENLVRVAPRFQNLRKLDAFVDINELFGLGFHLCDFRRECEAVTEKTVSHVEARSDFAEDRAVFDEWFYFVRSARRDQHLRQAREAGELKVRKTNRDGVSDFESGFKFFRVRNFFRSVFADDLSFDRAAAELI